MKALFLGGVAAGTAAGIRARLPAGLEVAILDDPIDRARLRQAVADAEILVSNHWSADYPAAPRVQLVQSVATGVELIELAALPAGVAVCNAFGHESAIAEYVVMVRGGTGFSRFRVSSASMPPGARAGCKAAHRTARCEAARSVSSAMAASGARWRGAQRRSAVASWPPIARQESRSPESRASSRSPISTACCPNATLWHCAPHSAPRPPV